MSDRQIETQEYARNPNPEIRISCTECKKDYPLGDVLKEEALPFPRNTVVEGYLVCPSCGARRHSYYLTELLRFKQVELKRAIEKWHTTKTTSAWSRYHYLQKQFQENFDAAQKRYAAVFEKEESA